jgi:hypothetical protein
VRQDHLVVSRPACRGPFGCHIEVCASGIWSLDGGPSDGKLVRPKYCVRFKTWNPSHGCEYRSTAVKFDITLDHKPVKRWCDVQTETVRPGGLWLVLAGLRASCRWAQHLASDVMSISHAVGARSSGPNMWNVVCELSS